MKEFKKHIKENPVTYTIIAVVLIVVLGGILIREFSSAFGTYGILSIQADRTGMTISVNEKARETIYSTGTIELKLKPGNHNIGIEHTAFWPWQKTIEIVEGETTYIAPFNLPREAQLSTLSSGIASDKPKSRSLFSVEKDRDNLRNPLLNEKETLSIFQTDAGIHAEWLGPTSSRPDLFCIDGVCENEFVVTTLAEYATSIHFLPGRDDVLLITTRDGIFGLELDRRDTQNFQPLFPVEGVDMRRRDNTSIYIEADGARFIYELY